MPVPPDELRRLATTLNEMLGRLQAGLERERRFVDDASHELRTPLALHKTELELALRYAGDERELRTAIESGIAEVDRLAQLADDLLVVARTGEGGLAIDRVAFDPSALLDGIASRFEARASADGRRIVVNPGELPPIVGDRLRLEQALTNLVDNALRHGAGEVALAGESRGNEVRLTVRDRGPGFSEDFRERAFERFSRADDARTGGGSGLGLAIVEAIATAHGGRAGIGDRPGDGTEVWIDLPLG